MLLDVQPHSLGIESKGGQMTRLVPRNTTIPNRKSMVFSTDYDSQLNLPTCVLPICIFEGERQRVKDNNLLGKFELPNISSSLRVSQIEVTIEIDANSVLHVSVLEKDTGKRSNLFITKIDRLYKEEIERMQHNLRNIGKAREAEAARVSAKNAREFQTSVETPVNLYRTDEQRLGRFFSMSDNARNTYTDLELQNISDLLHIIGYDLWSKVPRLYTVLRIIG
jgi:heat shock protein 1/8